MVIALGNVSLAPGGTGMIDISIFYNNNPISSDNSDSLSGFGLELLVAQDIGATSFLQFTASQADPYGNSDYVFAGESFKSDLGLPLWGQPSSTNYPFDTLIGGDSDDGSTLGYVTIPTGPVGPHSYLATVAFQAPPGASQDDRFQISLVNDPNFTYFDDQNGSALPYTMTGGMITIASVQEPSALVMAAISGLGGLLGYLRSRRHGHSPGSP